MNLAKVIEKEEEKETNCNVQAVLIILNPEITHRHHFLSFLGV